MIFDILAIAVLLISALHAFWRGFIREVLTILGALGGLFAAVTFGAQLIPITNGWLGVEAGKEPEKLFDAIPYDQISIVLAYAIVFIIVFGILSVFSHLIAESARSIGLGAVDRTLGVVFGLARGLLVLGIFYLPVHLAMDNESKEKWFKDARTHVYVEGVARMIEHYAGGLLPHDGDKDDKEKSVTTGARDALRQMQILPGEKTNNTEAGTTPPPPDPSSAPQPQPNNGQGYAAPARQLLNNLIDQENAAPAAVGTTP